MSDETSGDDFERVAVVKKLERVHDGFFKVDEATVSHTTFDGGRQTVTRECLERGDAAAVILLDRMAKTVWLVEQFRYPTLEKSGGWIEELPAGIVRAGEDPEATAAREVAEETGFEVKSLERAGEFYVSPGGSSERVFLFMAIVERAKRSQAVMDAGKDSDEDIRLVEIAVADFIANATNGRINDAKTLVGALWLAAHRERLRI